MTTSRLKKLPPTPEVTDPLLQRDYNKSSKTSTGLKNNAVLRVPRPHVPVARTIPAAQEPDGPATRITRKIMHTYDKERKLLQEQSEKQDLLLKTKTMVQNEDKSEKMQTGNKLSEKQDLLLKTTTIVQNKSKSDNIVKKTFLVPYQKRNDLPFLPKSRKSVIRPMLGPSTSTRQLHSTDDDKSQLSKRSLSKVVTPPQKGDKINNEDQQTRSSTPQVSNAVQAVQERRPEVRHTIVSAISNGDVELRQIEKSRIGSLPSKHDTKNKRVTRHPFETQITKIPTQTQKLMEDEKKRQLFKLSKMKILGEGTYGKVYEVQHTSTLTRFAMKTVKDSIMKHADYNTPVSMIRETSCLKRLSGHENIVKLVDEFRIPDVRDGFALVFELCDWNLHQFMKFVNPESRSLNIETARHIAYQLMKALVHCQENQVLHRDIKPENVLLNFQGYDWEYFPDLDSDCVKLADFGLARIYPNAEDINAEPLSDEVMTLSYRPPEIILSLEESYSYNADLWSYGCVLSYMFLGYIVFPGDSGFDVFQSMCKLFGCPKVETHPFLKRCTAYKRRQLEHYGLNHIKGLGWYRLHPQLFQVPASGIYLLERTMMIDPYHRCSVSEIWNDPFFYEDIYGQDKDCNDIAENHRLALAKIAIQQRNVWERKGIVQKKIKSYRDCVAGALRELRQRENELFS